MYREDVSCRLRKLTEDDLRAIAEHRPPRTGEHRLIVKVRGDDRLTLTRQYRTPGRYGTYRYAAEWRFRGRFAATEDGIEITGRARYWRLIKERFGWPLGVLLCLALIVVTPSSSIWVPLFAGALAVMFGWLTYTAWRKDSALNADRRITQLLYAAHRRLRA